MNDGNEPQQDTPAVTPAPYDGVERRMDHDEWRAHVNQRLDDGAATMKALKEDIADNTAATKENKEDIADVKADTSEVVSLLKSFQGAFAVFNMVGKLARPMGYILALVAAGFSLWSAVKAGVHTPPP